MKLQLWQRGKWCKTEHALLLEIALKHWNSTVSFWRRQLLVPGRESDDDDFVWVVGCYAAAAAAAAASSSHMRPLLQLLFLPPKTNPNLRFAAASFIITSCTLHSQLPTPPTALQFKLALVRTPASDVLAIWNNDFEEASEQRVGLLWDDIQKCNNNAWAVTLLLCTLDFNYFSLWISRPKNEQFKWNSHLLLQHSS